MTWLTVYNKRNSISSRRSWPRAHPGPAVSVERLGLLGPARPQQGRGVLLYDAPPPPGSASQETSEALASREMGPCHVLSPCQITDPPPDPSRQGRGHSGSRHPLNTRDVCWGCGQSCEQEDLLASELEVIWVLPLPGSVKCWRSGVTPLGLSVAICKVG